MSAHSIEVGFAISAEEFGPHDLVEQAVMAEQAGFRTIAISDHFHPWVNKQGHSPNIWPVLGAIAARTSEARFGTAVTCPILRTHPAVVAHAAATVAVMSQERFFLGVGTGENLNEHVLGQPWPAPDDRIEMLTEAVEVMRMLWTGEKVSTKGSWYTVDRAKLYDVPEASVPVYVSAFGEKALEGAARIGDGYIGTSPAKELIEEFDRIAGKQLPKIAYDKVCWAEDEATARRTIFELWPHTGVGGQASQELPTPEVFEQASENVTEEQAVGDTPVGPDVEPYLEHLKKMADAGYTTVCLHQVGPDQEGFLRFWDKELRPAWESISV